MRLPEHSRQVIQQTVAEIFGQGAEVRLFGSRLDDAQRGGDIDLLIELHDTTGNREQKTLQLTARLQLRLGDQPIDILVIDPSTQRQAIHQQALETGVLL